MAALREARQAQWAADVEQARKEGKLSARQAALDIQVRLLVKMKQVWCTNRAS